MPQTQRNLSQNIRVPRWPTLHTYAYAVLHPFSVSVYYSWTGPEREPEKPAAPLPPKENEQQKRQKIINWPNDRQRGRGGLTMIRIVTQLASASNNVIST